MTVLITVEMVTITPIIHRAYIVHAKVTDDLKPYSWPFKGRPLSSLAMSRNFLEHTNVN